MDFVYDGSHLRKEKESLLVKYTNNVSVWVVFGDNDTSCVFQARLGEEVLREFKKFEACDAFVDGMSEYAKKEGEIFKEEELNKIPLETEKLRKELIRANREKERAKEMAEKLIKGIVKDKTKGKEEKMDHAVQEQNKA